MADLMQKSKIELVAMIQDMEMRIRNLQESAQRFQIDHQSNLDELDRLRNVNQAMTVQNEDIIAEKEQVVLEQRRLESEMDQVISDNNQIRSEASRIQHAYETLVAHHRSLEKKLAEFEQQVRENQHKSDAAYELFKSFVDSDSRKTILVDTSYSICYLNQSAAAHLRLSEPGMIIGRRLFDFFSYKESLKVKKKIDAAFFSGEKEKIKDLVFQNPKGAEIPIDLKFMRVRYRDKPSIRMIIK